MIPDSAPFFAVGCIYLRYPSVVSTCRIYLMIQAWTPRRSRANPVVHQVLPGVRRRRLSWRGIERCSDRKTGRASLGFEAKRGSLCAHCSLCANLDPGRAPTRALLSELARNFFEEVGGFLAGLQRASPQFFRRSGRFSCRLARCSRPSHEWFSRFPWRCLCPRQPRRDRTT